LEQRQLAPERITCNIAARPAEAPRERSQLAFERAIQANG
jgi:hypothetical protein